MKYFDYFNRCILVVALLFTFQTAFAKQLEVKLVSKNSNGKEIYSDSHNYEIFVPDFPSRQVPNSKGIATFTISNYVAGKRIKFEVNKPGWHIAYPPNGYAHLPKNEADQLKIVLEVDNFNFVRKNQAEQFIYTVQAIATTNETVARQKADKLTQENRPHIAYVERYLVSNMPENGFIYKVKIGQFAGKNAKKDAEVLSYKLDNKYREIDGFFVSLKNHK